MPQQSSITSVDIPREIPRKMVTGWGRTAGASNGLIWGIGCGWRMSHLRWLARRVNAPTPSKLRYWSMGCALSFSRTLVACYIGGKRMQIRRTGHRGFNVLHGGSRFFITENAPVSDCRHARHNFQFPNLLRQFGWQVCPQIVDLRVQLSGNFLKCHTCRWRPGSNYW